MGDEATATAPAAGGRRRGAATGQAAADVVPRAARRKPAAARKRAVRWSTKTAKAFLAALAETANVAASARKAKVSESTLYRRRQADPDFAAAWAAALREGFLKLESLLLARALAGTTKDVWYGGKKVGETHEFDDRLALSLLNHHRASVTGAAPAAAPIPIEEARARFRARLAEMNRRMGGAG